MANYTAVVYEPTPGLVATHNSVRLGGQNELSLKELSTSGSFSLSSLTSGGIYSYFVVGVLSPAIVMLLMYFIWMCSLCCAKVCCKGCCGKTPALLVFTIAGVVSILGWVLALIGNGETTAGFMKMVDAVVVVQQFGNTTIYLALGAAALAASMEEATNAMSTHCTGSVAFPLAGVLGSLSEVQRVSGPNSELQSSIRQYNGYIDEYLGTAVEYLDWREYAFGVVIGVMLALTIFFVLSTVLRVMDHTPESCQGVSRCTSKLSSTCVFIFGILIMLIIWIFLFICHVLVTFGADICVPSPNYTINRITAEVMDLNTTDACLDPSYRDGMGGVLCHYQTCTGPNTLESFTDPIREQSLEAKAQVDDFFVQLESVEVPSAECTAARARFNAENDVIADRVSDILDVVTCAKINPVYAAVLYDGICNGLFGGLYLTYATLIVGSVTLMLAMSVFRIFDFGAYQDGQLPTAVYAEDDVDYNGPPGGNGQVAAYNGYEKNP